MNDGKNLRFDHFLSYEIWKEACKLLEAQVQYKKDGKNIFRTLPFYYYESLTDIDREKVRQENYYQHYIASNLCYALKKEFFWYDFSLPKPGIGIRKHTFFSYPFLALYYAVGLYLFKLSTQLVRDIKGDNKGKLYIFYGGNLQWGESGVNTNYYENLHYFKQHDFFRKEVSSEKKGKPSKDRVIIELDVQNYFENAHIDILLRNLNHFVKPSDKRILHFDASTQESIRFFFQFLNKGTPAIVQSYQNIISSYLGYLYLLFGDLYILGTINELDPNQKIIQDYKIIRYVDDTFLSLTFEEKFTKTEKKRFILRLLNRVAQAYYEQLNLRFNKKFGLYFLDNEKDVKKLNTRLKYTSIEVIDEEKQEPKKKLSKRSNPTPENGKGSLKAVPLPDRKPVNKSKEVTEVQKEDPGKKVKKLLVLLRRIKNQGVDFLYNAFAERIENYREEVDEVLKYIYDVSVNNIINSKEYKYILERRLNDFPFEIFRLDSKAFTVLISRSSKAVIKYREFLLKTKAVTIFDSVLIHDYLTQIDIQDQKLLKKLKKNSQWRPLVKAYEERCVFPKNDYCKVPSNILNFFEVDINITEQIRLRRHHENLQEYSVALNHLLNEFHAICRTLDEKAGSGKNYDVNKVVKFLSTKGISSKEIIGIRNLFDRRNKNPISHPGENKLVAWAVTPEEYSFYKKLVMGCLRKLMLSSVKKSRKKKAVTTVKKGS